MDETTFKIWACSRKRRTVDKKLKVLFYIKVKNGNLINLYLKLQSVYQANKLHPKLIKSYQN